MSDQFGSGTLSRLYCEGAHTQGVVFLHRAEYPYMRKGANGSEEYINRDNCVNHMYHETVLASNQQR